MMGKGKRNEKVKGDTGSVGTQHKLFIWPVMPLVASVAVVVHKDKHTDRGTHRQADRQTDTCFMASFPEQPG